MAIKIESQVVRKLPADTLKSIEGAFDSLPREHTRGLERIRLVEFISEPRLRGTFQATELPGLYHPRQGPKGAWLELAIGVLFTPLRANHFAPLGLVYPPIVDPEPPSGVLAV